MNKLPSGVKPIFNYCFGFRLKEVAKSDWSFSFGVQTDWDLHVYIHEPGDEIWLVYLGFPVDVAYFRLDVNNSDGMMSTDITVKTNEIVRLDKPTVPCKSYMQKVKMEVNMTGQVSRLLFIWGWFRKIIGKRVREVVCMGGWVCGCGCVCKICITVQLKWSLQ